MSQQEVTVETRYHVKTGNGYDKKGNPTCEINCPGCQATLVVTLEKARRAKKDEPDTRQTTIPEAGVDVATASAAP